MSGRLRLWSAWRALNGPTANCDGFETSSVMVRVMRMEGLPVVTTLSDATGPFHGVILCDVLEHLEEPRAVLRDLRNRLVDGGLLCLSVPDFSNKRIKAVAKRLARGESPPRELSPWEHLNYFSPFTLRRMLWQEDLETIEPTADIGLRPNLSGIRRAGNAMKSLGRLIRLAATGSYYGTTTVLARKPNSTQDCVSEWKRLENREVKNSIAIK